MNKRTRFFLRQMAQIKNAPALTADEKLAIKNIITVTINNDSPPKEGIYGAILDQPMARQQPIFSFSNVFALFFKPLSIALVALALLVAGVGTSWAAEYSLPGDRLYTIKINFNEEITGLTALTARRKALWVMHRFQRRLQEAEKLAAQGRLNLAAEEELRKDFADYTAHYGIYIASLSKSNRIALAAEVTSDFETILRAHAQLLADGAPVQKASSVKIVTLLDDIRAHSAKLMELKEALQNQLIDNNAIPLETIARLKLHDATNSLTLLKKIEVARKQKQSLATPVERQLLLAQEAFNLGKKRFNQGNYGEAYNYFQHAESLAEGREEVVEMQFATTTLSGQDNTEEILDAI